MIFEVINHIKQTEDSTCINVSLREGSDETVSARAENKLKQVTSTTV